MKEESHVPTRKERRKLARQGTTPTTLQQKINFELKHFSPLTHNQRRTFDAYRDGKNLMLHGAAGTGKSFISIYLALDEILNKNSEYKKLVIVRSAVPTRDIGFMPGNAREKMMSYEAPYYPICSEIFGRGDAYEYLKSKHLVEFLPTSFVRGTTISGAIVIVDEIANLTLHELDSIITRVGKNCRIIFCGDFHQSDFTSQRDRSGLRDFMKIVEHLESFTCVDFTHADIVRSGLVREYLITKDELGITC
jgi:phosphate starvation-inducible protein PhoH